MKKIVMMMLFVLCGITMTACIEDGSLSAPDAGSPTDEPDATTPDDSDATPVQPDASPPDACPIPDAPSQCEDNNDCNDGLGWTGDACNGSDGSCVHWVTDCGGMQVRPASNAATCQFWGGFGVPEPALLLATTAPSSLPAGPSGGDWKAAPQHACSVICYNPGLDETTVDIQIEWNGLTFLHQQLNGLHKGTWDGQNTR